MTTFWSRIAVSVLVTTSFACLLFYGYLAAMIGRHSTYAQWLVPLLFYVGLALSFSGLVFTLLRRQDWMRRAFTGALIIVLLFAIFLLAIEPHLQQYETRSRINALQQLYQEYSLEQLDCGERYQVHLSKINQRPAELVLFDKENDQQHPVKLAGWERTTSMNACRFIENTYFLGTQRHFLEQCVNDRQMTVDDLLAWARSLDCP